MKSIIMHSTCLAAALSLATSAFGQERSLLTQTSDVKGYGKRDRVFLGSDQTISPSQLHEIYGARVDAALQYSSASTRFLNDEKATMTSPSVTARGFWSGDVIAVGLGANSTQGRLSSPKANDFEEQQSSLKLLPQIAFTLTNNFTIGLASDVNWMSVRNNDDSILERDYNFYTRRESIGASFHTPKMEMGIVHATAAHAAKSIGSNAPSVGFGLLPAPTGAERELYAPAHTTIFARGNLTDQLSMHGSLSHVQYDDNMAGAKNVFDNYRTEDRVATQLQAVWWMPNRKTRYSVTGAFSGATYAPFGTEEAALGYRDANLWGGSVDAIFAWSPKTYIGAAASFMQGERDQITNGEVAIADEERFKLATTLNVNL